MPNSFGMPVSVATRSKAWDCGFESYLARMSARCEFCVLSGRGYYVGLITRPEESHRVWCVWVWSWSLDIVET